MTLTLSEKFPDLFETLPPEQARALTQAVERDGTQWFHAQFGGDDAKARQHVIDHADRIKAAATPPPTVDQLAQKHLDQTDPGWRTRLRGLAKITAYNRAVRHIEAQSALSHTAKIMNELSVREHGPDGFDKLRIANAHHADTVGHAPVVGLPPIALPEGAKLTPMQKLNFANRQNGVSAKLLKELAQAESALGRPDVRASFNLERIASERVANLKRALLVHGITR